MLRYVYLVSTNLFGFLKMILKMQKLTADEKCSEQERYDYLRYMVSFMQRKGFTRTNVYGEENLPEQGGYVMYPNHQGKYDAFGIVGVHPKACTVVMDRAKSNALFIKQVIDMLGGKRLDKESVKQAFGVVMEVAEEVRQGKKYIIFPEGGYDKTKRNTLWDFKPGCFKASVKSKTPIVPVALFDSHKAWNSSLVGMVVTQVHYLQPIYYEEYKEMRTKEIATLVKERIQNKIDEIANLQTVI